MIYSINLMFMLLLMTSTIIVLSSPSWFCMWIGIEINTMAFIPMMYNPNNKLPTESMLKYFFIQTFGSMIMMMAIIIISTNTLNSNFMMSKIMFLSMMIKLGTAPFHMWYPSVIEGLSWSQNMWLMTWQKIAPLSIMSFITPSIIHIITIISSLIIGSMGAFNQTSTRKIMAYSSITHMSWIISMMMLNSTMWTIYMMIYFMTTLTTIYLLMINNIYHMMQINNIKSMQMKYSIFISLLSMGGFPPTLGFMAKWLIINELIKQNMIMISIMMVMSSWMNLYVYLRIIHPNMHNMSSYTKTNMFFNKKSITPSMIMILSLFPMFMIIM